MKSSPSQCVNFERCHRAWWFQSVRKMYPPSHVSQEFGTALHALLAQHLRGQEGEPAGWNSKIDDRDADRIRRFRDRAIEQGVVRYRPKLLVEYGFSVPVGSMVQNGVVDCLDLNGVVEDHKTSASERWLKTQDDLRNDLPMMSYAGALLVLNKVEKVWLRHNQFVLDANDSVTFTEVAVTAEEVRAFWKSRIIPALGGQQKYRECMSWDEVPGQPQGSEACSAFKGCAFVPICHGGIPIDKFSFETKFPVNDLPF